MKANHLTQFYEMRAIDECPVISKVEGTQEMLTCIFANIPYDNLLYLGRVVLKVKLDASMMIRDLSHPDHDHSRRFHLFGRFAYDNDVEITYNIPHLTSSVVPIGFSSVVFDITEFARDFRRPNGNGCSDNYEERNFAWMVFVIRRSCDKCKNETYYESGPCVISQDIRQHFIGISPNPIFNHNTGHFNFSAPNIVEWNPLEV